MSDTIEPVEHPRNYEIPGWSNADAINARDATIREQAAEIERLRANRDYWMSACNQAQEHRDGANAQLTIFESENLQLRIEIERLRRGYPRTEIETGGSISIDRIAG